jgi:parvulin-like peptidyl-prolyl isomerase
MGMMNTMRTKMHFVLWGLLIMFLGSMTVGGLVGGADILDEIFGLFGVSDEDPQKSIAIVNGELITPDMFFQVLQNRRQTAKQQEQELSERDNDQLYDEIWNELVQLTLIDQEVEQLEIEVTDDEVYFELESNPPQIFQSVPDFQTDGSFDQKKFLTALHNPQGDEWLYWEAFTRDYLPRKKLLDRIRYSVTLSEDEVRQEFITRNVDHVLSGLAIPASSFRGDEFNATDEDITAFYKSHMDDFQQDETRVLRYVKWDKKPAAEDTTDTEQFGVDLIRKINDGADFVTLAEIHSADPGSAVKGGDLGWFGRGRMVPPFEEAAFNANSGEIVGPVESNFGYHIIWVREKRGEGDTQEVLASHILLNIEMGPSTLSRLKREATQFLYEVEDNGFGKAVEISNVSLDSSRQFTENSTIPDFGFTLVPTRFAFRSEIDAISDIIETDNSFAIMQLIEIHEPGPQPLEDVRKRIERDVRQEKQMARAEERIDEVYKELLAGKNFAELSETHDDVKLIEEKERKLSTALPYIGSKNPRLLGLIASSGPGELYDPFEGQRSWVIIRYDSQGEIDEEEWLVQKDFLYNELLTNRQNEAVNAYITELTDNADIVDNRRYHIR